MLAGVLPPNIGNALPNLEELLFGGNMFGGHIPASLGNASKLTWIDFMDNSFAGAIGEWIGKLTNLEYIYILKATASAAQSSTLLAI